MEDVIDLPDVTLICVDCVNVSLALRAMRKSAERCRFARMILFTSESPETPGDIQIVRIAKIGSKREYSHFLIRELATHVATSHALVMQWDGYVVRPEAWDPNWLHYDYIGAPWPPDLSPTPVGNGGFSLRSRRLLEALTSPAFPEEQIFHEDQAICVTFRARLESEFGIQFAPADVAGRFSHETVHAGQATFGFHGPQNLWLYWDAEAINVFVHEVSRAVLRHPEVTWLARHLYEAGRLAECAQVAAAALVEQPNNSELLDILANLRERMKPHSYIARSEQRFLLGMMKRHLPEYFRERKVLEIGRTIEGPSVREWFDATCHLVTITPPTAETGEGAEIYSAASGSFDTIVSCETLEHLPYWREVVANALRLLKADGLMILSCAGLGRRQHETPRQPGPPGGMTGTFYRNIAAADIAGIADLGALFARHWLIEDHIAHDLYFIALGRQATPVAVATLTSLMTDLDFLSTRKHVFGLH